MAGDCRVGRMALAEILLITWLSSSQVWGGPMSVVTEHSPPGEYLDARELDGICAYRGGSDGQSLMTLGFTNLEQPTQPAQCLEMLMHDRVDAWVTSDIGRMPLFAEAAYLPRVFNVPERFGPPEILDCARLPWPRTVHYLLVVSAIQVTFPSSEPDYKHLR